MAPVTLGWLHLVALLGAAQGILLTVVLATKRRNHTANMLLGTAMLAFSIYLASAVYLAAGLERVFPHFFGIAYPMPLLFGPLIYLYSVYASDRSLRWRRKDWLHFLPFLATLAWAMPIYLMSGPEKLEFYKGLQQGIRPTFMVVVDQGLYVSGISYAFATITFLRRHRRRVMSNYSTLEQVNLRWLLSLASGGAAIWAIATGLHFLEAAGYRLPRPGDDLVALAVAVMVYGIGYMGVRQPEIFDYARHDVRMPGGSTGTHRIGGSTGNHRTAPHPPVAAPLLTAAEPVEERGPRYERSGLGEEEAAELKATLLGVMEEERPYQDGELTLADLADRLETTPHKLSEILNSELHQTFYDFVNAYRVREVQRRIADAGYRNLTILALAMDAGFASKSTFNHVFKKHTGQTPSAYRRAAS